MATKVLHTFSNAADGLTAFVFVSAFAGFGVSLRDDDEGEFVNTSIHGLTEDEAIAKAKAIVNFVETVENI
jgi:hypothetical protein